MDDKDSEHLTNHKFIREFKENGAVQNGVSTVTDLTEYLRMIDSAMNLYFESNEDEKSDQELEELYGQFLGIPGQRNKGRDRITYRSAVWVRSSRTTGGFT